MTDIRFKLNTGAEIPAIGLGTCPHVNKQEFINAVKTAILDAGYRHIDTAFFYRCEDMIGEALNDIFATGKIKREDLFITTKVWPTFHDKVEQSIDASLKALRTDYVDLALIHWPYAWKYDNPDGIYFEPENKALPANDPHVDSNGSYLKTYSQFETVYKTTKKVKAIGVSNFGISELEDLLTNAEIVPAVNQVQANLFNPQLDLIKYCQSKGIVVTAYSPIGGTGAPSLKNELVIKLAKKYNVNEATIALSYHISNGVVVVPKSFNPERIKLNASYVKLEKEDLEALKNAHTY